MAPSKPFFSLVGTFCRLGKNRELSLGAELVAAAASGSEGTAHIFNKISPFIAIERNTDVVPWAIVNDDWVTCA